MAGSSPAMTGFSTVPYPRLHDGILGNPVAQIKRSLFASFSPEKEVLVHCRSLVAEKVISGKFSFMRFSSQLLRTK
jgi:hypothetical protein